MLLSIDCDSLNALAIISKHGSLLDIVIITGFDSLRSYAVIRVNDSFRLFAVMQTCDIPFTFCVDISLSVKLFVDSTEL